MSRPNVSLKDLSHDLGKHYSIRPNLDSVQELESYDDRMFSFSTEGSGEKLIAKYYNTTLINKKQLTVLARVLDALVEFNTPKIRLAIGQTPIVEVSEGLLVLFRRIPGEILGSRPQPPSFWHSLGRIVAQISLQMATVDSSDFHRELDWDPRLTSRNLISLRLPEGVDRDKVMACVRRMERTLKDLPVQLSHADINEYNILVDEEHGMGLIDFNDMIMAPRVVEIAHCLAYMIHSQQLNTEVGRNIMKGYGEYIKLCEAERSIIYDLVVSRFGLSCAMGQQKIDEGTANGYVTKCVQDNVITLAGFLRLGRDSFEEEVLKD